jgi:hypothetical protein
MRSIAIIGVILSLSCPAFGQMTDRLPSQPHHQPTQAEVKERESERLGASARAEGARSANEGNEQIQARFFSACMARLHLDEPLGSQATQVRFCTCEFDTLKSSIASEDLKAVALNIEEHNAGRVYTSLLPANADRAHQEAIDACFNELSR